MSNRHLKQKLREFNSERGWERYHLPKNLAMALTVEAAELLECFQWLTPEESQNKTEAMVDEMADILIYLTILADKLDVDLIDAAHKKINKNAIKHPA